MKISSTSRTTLDEVATEVSLCGRQSSAGAYLVIAVGLALRVYSQDRFRPPLSLVVGKQRLSVLVEESLSLNGQGRLIDGRVVTEPSHWEAARWSTAMAAKSVAAAPEDFGGRVVAGSILAVAGHNDAARSMVSVRDFSIYRASVRSRAYRCLALLSQAQLDGDQCLYWLRRSIEDDPKSDVSRHYINQASRSGCEN